MRLCYECYKAYNTYMPMNGSNKQHEKGVANQECVARVSTTYVEMVRVGKWGGVYPSDVNQEVRH